MYIYIYIYIYCYGPKVIEAGATITCVHPSRTYINHTHTYTYIDYGPKVIEAGAMTTSVYSSRTYIHLHTPHTPHTHT